VKVAIAVLSALAVVLTVAPAPAVAAELQDPSDTYALFWTIGDHPLRDGDFWVKEQEQIVDTRLWPVTLYAVESPVSDSSGALLIPAGTQLVGLRANRLVACTQIKAAEGTAKGKRVCLADIDGDGAPDHAFTRGLGGLDWIALQGRFSDTKMVAIGAAKLRELRPKEMSGAPYISFHYQRILDGGLTIPLTQEGGHRVRFHFKVGRDADERRVWVVRDCADTRPPSFCTSANFPSRMAIAGLDLDLLERRGEDIRMRMAAPFHGQQVRFQNTSYSYYTQLTMFAE
jgi:hypothetical protein